MPQTSVSDGKLHELKVELVKTRLGSLNPTIADKYKLVTWFALFPVEWSFRVGWAGPYHIVREAGMRILGLEWRYYFTDASPKELSLLPPKKES